MTLEQIYYIAEIIAVVGILISLVLVLIQLRQAQQQLRENALAMKLNSEIEIAHIVNEGSKLLVETPGLATILQKARRDHDDMTKDERETYYAYLHMLTNMIYLSVTTYKMETSLDDVIRYHAALASHNFNCALGRQWLIRNRGMFADDFAAFMNGLAGLGPLVPPLPPDNFPPPERHDLIEGGKWAGVTALSIAPGVE